MTKKLITLVCFLSIILSLSGQTARNIRIEGSFKQLDDSAIELRSVVPCDLNSPGSIEKQNPQGQSNNNNVGDLITFLCLGDQFDVVQTGVTRFGDDPNPNTSPGVSYAIYDEFPTIDGPDLATIRTDPSLNKTSPIQVGPNPEDIRVQQNGLWIAESSGTQNIFGDFTFINNGGPQQQFGGGGPVQFWYAPITVNDFFDGFEARDGEEPGPCVTVGINEAFSVVYLNEIGIASALTTGNGCTQEWVLQGGLPEFDPTENYAITIRSQTDPSVVINLNNAGHGETLRFNLPQPGFYDVEVEDGKSCGLSFAFEAPDCEALSLNLPNLNAAPGATNVCLDLTVEGFNNIGVLQFSINWDPNIINYVGTNDINPNLPGAGVGEAETSLGNLTFNWPLSVQPAGINLNDGDILMSICFDIIGQTGDQSPVSITGNPTQLEFLDFDLQALGFILNDGQVNITLDNIFLDVEGVDPLCFGQTGSMIVEVAGGTPPYQVFGEDIVTGVRSPGVPYPDGLPELEIPNIPPGSYRIIVQDAMGEEVTSEEITLVEPLEFGPNLDFTAPQCFGDSLSQLTAQVVEGTLIVPNAESRFTFVWDTPFGDSLVFSSSTLQNVPLGRYSVTVTDEKGCTGDAAQIIPGPAEISIPPANVISTDATCSGAADGSLTITATGGTSATGTYTYEWSNGFFETATQSTNSNLNPGTYFVTITDDNGCMATDSTLVVGANKIFSLNIVPTDVSCFGEEDGNATAFVSVTGQPANLPLEFTWTDEFGNLVDANNINNNPTGTASTATMLPPGTYFVSADESAPSVCGITDSVIINEPDSLEINLLGTTVETCINGGGAMDATATIEVSGGTFPYSYDWTNPMMESVSMDSAAIMLSADTLMARVTDINGCIDSLEVLVGSLPPPTITSLPEDRLPCSDDVTGSLTVMTDPNGVTPVQIEWFASDTVTKVGDGPTANGLIPGIYFVRVLGDNDCAIFAPSAVLSPAPVNIDSVLINNPPTCPGEPNGQFNVFVSGGTEPYSYSWSNGINNPNSGPIQIGFSAGNFDVTVTDANNCAPAIATTTMIDPPQILVNFSDTTAVSCFNSTDGGAQASAFYSDGSPGTFNFSWDSGEQSANTFISTASNLPRDSVKLLVDDGTCLDSFFVFIPSPPDIEIFVDAQNITCNGDGDGSIALNVQGGTVAGDYMYNWATGETTSSISNLEMGTYEVDVIDDNNCIKNQFVTITEPRPFVLQVNPAFTEDVTCNGDTDGVIDLLAQGGTSAYSFQWNDGASDQVRENLAPGAYLITATDANGCQDSLSHTVNEPAPVLASILTPEPPVCFGDPTQLIILEVTGGNATSIDDYTYQVNGNNIPLPIDEPATIFPIVNNYTVTDNLGCIFSDTISVPEAPRLEIQFDPPSEVVELGDTLILTPIINAAPDRVLTYEWTPDANLSASDIENPVIQSLLDDINLRLTVTDQFGCTASRALLVELDANRNVYIPNAFSPDGQGEIFNEVFSVYACKGVTSILAARIFDRWGELIYEDLDITPVDCDEDRPGLGTELWDGTYNGKPMNEGTFAYTIDVEFLDGVRLTYRGTFHLIR